MSSADSVHEAPDFTASSAHVRSLLDAVGKDVLSRDRDNHPPYEPFDAVRRSRLGSARLPHGEGGGVDLPTLFELVIALAAADSNVAHSLRNHFQFVEGLIRRSDSRDQRWRDLVGEGQIFGSAIAEPNRPVVGRRVPHYSTHITSTDHGLRLSGEKIYSTGNLYADWLVVTAQSDEGSPVRVVVPARDTGIEHVDDWDGIGQRFTGSGTTRFVCVAVPPNNFYDTTIGVGSAAYTATFPQLYLTAVVAGILRTVTADAAQLVRDRDRTFYHASSEKPTDDPLLQFSVGQLSSAAFAAQSMVLSAARTLERAVDAYGTDEEASTSSAAALDAARAKVVVDDLALTAASQLFDTGGGSAVRQSAQLDRHWRNIRTLASHNPRTFKARAIGDYEISGRALPNGAFF
ncbi:hypothetical protein CH267_12925 [Rhodococcus sp. 06-621-2]|nr:acyl-CoA dehydrogenase family protein [Rhodococcus sp. 06-621-2]OZC55477.1 hypothetical protein CH267_12925 [Rhodococcus sp. 06-621-2]